MVVTCTFTLCIKCTLFLMRLQLEHELMMITDLDNHCEHVDDKLAYFSIHIQALAKEEAKHSLRMKELLQSYARTRRSG